MVISHPSMQRAGDISNQKSQPETETYVVKDETHPEATNPLGNQEQVHYSAAGPIGPPVGRPMGPPEIIPSPVSTSPAVESPNKNMLESLIFLGRINEEVEIGEFKFGVATLTHGEHNSLMQELYKIGDSVGLFTMRTLTLAHAVKSVNDTPLEDLPLSEEEEARLETKFDKKLAIIDGLQMNVVERLFDVYNALIEKSDSLLDGEQVKN